MKKTAIIGASTNPNRYAFIAAQMLVDHGHEIVPLGIKQGKCGRCKHSRSKIAAHDRRN